jgi:hypothetical protein
MNTESVHRGDTPDQRRTRWKLKPREPENQKDMSTKGKIFTSFLAVFWSDKLLPKERTGNVWHHNCQWLSVMLNADCNTELKYWITTCCIVDITEDFNIPSSLVKKHKE